MLVIAKQSRQKVLELTFRFASTREKKDRLLPVFGIHAPDRR